MFGVRRNTGFTLVELVLVVVILGILAATALPRFMDTQTQAHESVVKSVGNAFSTSVQMLHAQWRVNGAVPSQDNVVGFGDGSGTPPDPAADFWASSTTVNECTFDYQPLANLRITYNCLTGQVVIDADASS